MKGLEDYFKRQMMRVMTGHQKYRQKEAIQLPGAQRVNAINLCKEKEADLQKRLA